MAGVQTRTVASDDADIRLDRWFRRHFPDLTHGRLEKLLRTGQVRVDGKRAKAGQRIASGQEIRVPPLEPSSGDNSQAPTVPPRPAALPEDRALVDSLVLYQDDDLLVLNKPAGLPVQGGTRSTRNLDAILAGLAQGPDDRPRLVHRLDKDTSGVLLLAKSARVAAALGQVFRSREATKLYWALVVGRPEARRGQIDAALAKRAGAGGERVVAVDRRQDDARRSRTRYAEVDHAGGRLTWLALQPLTGRTHQLRVHCAGLGTPIAGDGKYGGRAAFVDGAPLERRLHLHARRLILPHPAGGSLDVTAPLPPHMAAAWQALNFHMEDDGDPFDLDATAGAHQARPRQAKPPQAKPRQAKQ